MTLELHGFRYSVYAWIARFALHEKGVDYDWVEVNPFADDVPAAYLDLHPFCRVPALVDGDFALYETGAITRYIDDKFDGPALRPAAPEARARVDQILSIVDSYVYWPLVRQVFSHGVFAARVGSPADRAEYESGLAAAPRVLDALDRLAAGGDCLVGDTLTLADIRRRRHGAAPPTRPPQHVVDFHLDAADIHRDKAATAGAAGLDTTT